MDSPRILLCEDEPAIADSLAHVLRGERMQVEVVGLAADALAVLAAAGGSQQSGFDLLVLDVGLPDRSGFDVCRELRKSSNMPILFLTARSDEIDRVVGLEIGGDDYITKPFSAREVAARIKAVLRRTATQASAPPQTASVAPSIPAAPSTTLAAPRGPSEPPPSTIRTIGWFELDDDRKRISFCQRVLDLTRNEYLLLHFLLGAPQHVFAREQILTGVWRDGTIVNDRSVDAHIKALRMKLRAITPQLDPIVTHRGHGYSINVAESHA
jgi:two-component system catabolic regulation response regulator CreB